MSYISFMLIISIPLICIFPIRYFIIYKKNKSSLNVDLSNDENNNMVSDIKLNKKYINLQKRHDELYNNSKKEMFLLPFVIAIFICVLLSSVNWYFIWAVFIMIVLVALLSTLLIKPNKKMKLSKEYENIIFNDIIIPLLDVKKINQVDINEFSSDEEFEFIEKYNKEQTQIIQNIMKNIGKKTYNRFTIKYDLDCQIKNYSLNIKKFSNSLKFSNDATSSIDSNYFYLFVGYFITIPNFYNIEKLNNLNKQNYYYDSNNSTLFLLVSEEIANDIQLFSFGKVTVNYNKSFNKNNILLMNYNFFKALRNYIISIIE